MSKTAKPYPFTEEQEAWLQDLETTDAPQTKEYLHVQDDFRDIKAGFCCLGRACITLGIPADTNMNFVKYDDLDNVLSDIGINKLRLHDDEGLFEEPADIDGSTFGSLVAMNDNGKTFKEIAAYIRANPWNVFKDPNEASDT